MQSLMRARARASPTHDAHARAGLHTEQMALVDMLVMSRAALFFGYTRSSMSFLIAQLRYAQGREDTAHWVSSNPPPHKPAPTIAQHAEFSYSALGAC